MYASGTTRRTRRLADHEAAAHYTSVVHCGGQGLSLAVRQDEMDTRDMEGERGDLV